jgi:hypothetical protein
MTDKEAMKLALDLAIMHHTDEGYAELRSKVRVAVKEVLTNQEQDEQDNYQGSDAAKAAHMMDLYTALGVRWGGDPFAVIAKMRDQQPKQEQGEPVAYDVRCDNCGGDGYDPKNNNYYCSVCEGSRFVEKMLYTTPQQRKPLTFEQVEDCFCEGATAEESGILVSAQWLHDFARAIEAAHGIKE